MEAHAIVSQASKAMRAKGQFAGRVRRQRMALYVAKAYATGMKQHLKLANFRAVAEHTDRLKELKVENMAATRKEDVREILEGIPDKDAFNRQLQSLIFEKLIPAWSSLDSREQMSIIGRIMKWQAVVDKRASNAHPTHLMGQIFGKS